MMVKDRYFIKIVPGGGNAIHRLEVTRRHIIGTIILFVAGVVAALGIHAYQLQRAKSALEALQVLTTSQSSQLKSIDHQTTTLKAQLQAVQNQNQQIQQLMGIHGLKTPSRQHRQKLSRVQTKGDFGVQAFAVEHKLNALSAASNATLAEAILLQRMTMRILNMRHIEALARDRMMAGIPSIDPVDGAAVVGCFCYRVSPDVGFHQGVDLGASYGETVRATAAGTVATADWDGGFGQKVDIDHGNGYHTWYAHLSRIDVGVGDRVVKGQPIALVGSTGFSTGPHLHYQVMLNGTPIDPEPYLAGVPPKVLAALP